MIKLVAFDLWQTLAFRNVEYHTTSRMLEETGAKIPKERIVKIFEESLQTRKWKSKSEAYGNLCKNMGLAATKQNVNKLIKIRDTAEAQTMLYPYAIPMLRQLRKQGCKTGLVSNSSVFAVRQLKRRTGLLKYIDYPLFSFDVGAIKPDVRFFKEMLRISGCRPGEAVMIGDKPNDDVLPPRSIGMNAILFRDYGQLKKDLAGFGIHIR